MNDEVKKLIAFAQKAQSKKLDLSFQNLNSIPKEIKNLNLLTELSIYGNQIRKIKNLPINLNILNISFNQIQAIENLPKKVTILYIRGNQIRKIENLPQDLIELNIDKNQIRKIENLPQKIKEFNVSENRITKIENLPDSIKRLSLNENQIRKIENLPQNLKYLFIQDNQIRVLENLPLHSEYISAYSNQIQEIKSLPPKLHSIELGDNCITSLVNSWTVISNSNFKIIWEEVIAVREVKELNLYKNPITIPPFGIIIQGHDAVDEYMSQYLKENQKQVYLFESKLLILGESGAGKTTFSRRLQNPKADLPTRAETTHGIEIGKWNFPIKSGEFEKLNHKDSTFYTNLWDFGGQEVYHGTHKFFFSEKSLYVLLVDTREEKTDFSFWLNTIEQLGGEESSLIVLMNKRENRNYQLNENGYRARFGSFFKEVYTVDLAISEDIPALQTQIKNHLKALPDVGVKLIESWVRIREDLAEETGHSITFKRFRDICKKRRVTDTGFIKNISRYFHRIGVFSHFIDDPILEDKIYLNSDWLTDAVYEVLDNEQAQNSKGRLSLKEIKKIAAAKDLDFEYKKLIALLEKFGLMYQTPSRDFIIPRHLSAQQPYPFWAHEKEEPKIHFQYTFDKYMPRGLMSQLIVALHQKIEDHNLVWNRGFNLSHNGAHAEIIEQYGGTNQFDIRIVGEFRSHLLVIIREAFDDILSPFKKLQVDRKTKCPCDECATSATPYLHNTADIEKALIKKYKKDNPQVECKNSFEDISIKEMIAFIDFDKVIRTVRESAPHQNQEAILEAIAKLTGNVDLLGIDMRSGFSKTYQKLDSLTDLVSALPTHFQKDLKIIENHLENLNINDARIEMLIEQVELEIKDLPTSNAWKQHFSKAKESEDWDVGAQGKLELVLPIIPGILHYKGEFNASFKTNLKEVWENLKAGNAFFE